MNKDITKSFESMNIKYTTGSAWTTDAPYRETLEKVKKYKKKGARAVDMEASAVFSVGKYRGANVSSLFLVSDVIYADKEEWDFHFSEARNKLKKIFDVALNTLKNK